MTCWLPCWLPLVVQNLQHHKVWLGLSFLIFICLYRRCVPRGRNNFQVRAGAHRRGLSGRVLGRLRRLCGGPQVRDAIWLEPWATVIHCCIATLPVLLAVIRRKYWCTCFASRVAFLQPFRAPFGCHVAPALLA